MDRPAHRLLRPAVIAGGLLAANVALAVGVAVTALRPRPVVVVPSARATEALFPDSVPAGAAREFALRYVLHFDNYTPATISGTHDVLRRMVSPRSWARAVVALDRRKEVADEGRMSSQVIPTSTEVDGLVVTVEAIRRTFISDTLSRESTVRYVVVLERQPPTEPNPFGLAVVSQEITEVP